MSGVTRTQAISAFLRSQTHDDLSLLYNHNMECQVNVAQDNGERVEGEFKGKIWHGWTDGVQTWKSFRIPRNANTEPEYTDTQMMFDLTTHAEGIGMTGWDWYDKLSRWVAFDFDAITGHSEKHTRKLTHEELEEIKNVASSIPWVTTRLSTSGKGLHLYVFLDPVNTVTHTEHAALARAILGLMSAHTGFDFSSKVDICGGNMWVWHRKMRGTDGLILLKKGEVLCDVPSNWCDHIHVISGRRRHILPNFAQEISQFDELTGQRARVKLDAEHRKLIEHLENNGASFWWDQDHHMLVAHTYDLAQAHEALNFHGIFRTLATGREHGVDHNCFLFPMRRGAWSVRRYTPGVKEDTSWEQDGNGWTRCFLNVDPTLEIAARAHGGIEDEGGKFIFRHAELAQNAALSLGTDLNLPPAYGGRKTVMKYHKDGKRLVVEVDREPTDDPIPGWLSPKGKTWKRIFTTTQTNIETETGNYDDVIRHLVTETGQDYGWVVKADDKWHIEPLTHVRMAISVLGLKHTEINDVIGNSVFKPWMIVNRPFQPEYPGDRTWNRDAAQLRFVPNPSDKLSYPSWSRILEHVGRSLDNVIIENAWAKANAILTGADYLKCWIASLLQFPEEPLPYLFLFGPQNSGKSILHEALSLLLTRGYVRADNALTSKSNFNGELENAILCIVEETDLRRDKAAYNKIKDWVTSREISIRKLYHTPFHAINTTHWIQCSNERGAFPAFSGDTRVVMLYVDELSEPIPKRELLTRLEKEAPDFLAEVLKLELPQSNDRLNLPIITTEDKLQAEQVNLNTLEIFIEECCYYVPGEWISVSDFYEKFIAWLEPNERFEWSKIKIGKNMPTRFPKGRNPKDAQWFYGNISFEDKESTGPKLVVKGGKLVSE